MEWTVANVLAVWGAGLATVLGVIRVIEYLRDKPRLRVSGKQCWWNSESFSEPLEMVMLRAVNIGKRPVQVTGCQLELSNGKALSGNPIMGYERALPCRLDEGDVCDFPMLPEQLKKALAESGAEIVGVVFHDAAERAFRGKWGGWRDEQRRLQFGEYRTKRLILGYYDAYVTGDPAALSLWLGPDDSRAPQVHSMDTMPEGT